MISTVDKLLLTADQQAQLEKLTNAYNASYAAGDQKGMAEAHSAAEELRAAAGYSGGHAGDRYQLLKAANAPQGYSPYEDLIGTYATGEMHAIAAGYEDALAQLDTLRKQIEAEGEKNQASARSAVWDVQRLANDGLLTRGYENTGIANAVTAAALNQASANAYQALLDTQNDLAENTLARAEARTDALGDAAELERYLGEQLSGAYRDLYTDQKDRQQEITLQQMKSDAEMKQLQAELQSALKQQQMKSDAALEQMEQDYYYQLALAKLKQKMGR